MKRPGPILLVLALACAPAAPDDERGDPPVLPDQVKLDAGAAAPDAGGEIDAGGESPDAGLDAPDGGTTEDAGTPDEEQWAYPEWTLEDVQTQSARRGEKYGLEAFRGRALVVMLLEGFCTYCRLNALVAQELMDTLAAEGREVAFVVLSDAFASEYNGRVNGPIFREPAAGRPAWQAMRQGATKHDTFVFAPNGLRTYFWEGSYTGDAPRWREQVGAAVRAVVPPR